MNRYVIVSPVKDEERYVEETLRSVVQQTLKPQSWIIVNDGSKDGTARIISGYARRYPFIRMQNNPGAGERQTGSAVMRAFKLGCESIMKDKWDFIVKLDCDLSFDEKYFEKLLGKMSGDEKYGISSGVYWEMNEEGGWTEIVMPPYHAAGACKVIRRKCFEQIAGFIGSAGWDTVDEIRAINYGWKTGHHRDLHMKHLKKEGSGMGVMRTGVMQGEIYRRTGGDPLFFFLKVLHRMTSKPIVLGGIALAWGYVKSILSRQPLLVSSEEARCYRRLLRNRMAQGTRRLLGTG